MSKRPSYPLDLSALAYPMMRSRRTQSNFRFSARLIDEVDPSLLERSLAEVLLAYPNLKTRIVPSFFWHKLVRNDAPLLVKEDDRPPLTPFCKKDTNGYPFRLAYRENEIVLEIFHAATDGDVGALFMTDLLNCYCALKEGCEPPSVNRKLTVGDAFLVHAKKKSFRKISLHRYNGTSAVALGERGNYLPSPTLLSCDLPISELKAAARSWDATLTEYVAACYITAIAETQPLPLTKPLCLFLPVNLRRFFPSDTLQNFVCFERITLPRGESDLSFARVLSIVHAEFMRNVTRENMQEHVDDVRRTLTLPLVKYFPLFLKKPLFKFFRMLLNKVRQTAILSNVGTLSLSPEAERRVKDLRFFLNIGKNAPLNVAVLSYGGSCRVSLTCGLKETDVPARFFELLRTQGKK